MKRVPRILATVVAVLTVLGGAATSATAAPRALVPGLPLYLALGDSLAAGQQSVPPVVDAETTIAAWKANGYVAQLHDTLRDELDCLPARSRAARDGCRQLQLLNLGRTAVPGGAGGVTTATMLQDGDQLDRAVALLQDRNQDRNPRNDVEVITLNVGGNDLFRPAVTACVPPTGACVPTLQATFAGFAERYDAILAELRAAAGPDTVIMTMTYYNPLPFCVLGASDPAAAAAIGDLILEGGTAPFGTLPAGFNDIIRAVSAQHGAIAVDAYGEVGAEELVGGTDCLHPDADGHRVIADLFAAALPG